MGYTHYLRFKNSHGKTKEVEKLYQAAIKDCNNLIKDYYNDNKGTENSLSGYSAHVPGKYGGLNFNGKGDNAHEDFSLREHFKENEKFVFCKTAYKPYDIVVVACCVLLKYYLNEFIEVSSDGGFENWVDGTEYVAEVFPDYPIDNPLFDGIQGVK